jgi:predicted nucleic acid-binding protein
VSPPELRFVIDASVLIKLFVKEPYSDKAGTLFARVEADPYAVLFSPDLVYTECANVLWKYTIRFGMTGREARRKLNLLNQVVITIIPTRNVLSKALDLAYRYRITVYDACYVATSQMIGVPLITSDEKLIKAVGSRQGSVISLRDCNV